MQTCPLLEADQLGFPRNKRTWIDKGSVGGEQRLVGVANDSIVGKLQRYMNREKSRRDIEYCFVPLHARNSLEPRLEYSPSSLRVRYAIHGSIMCCSERKTTTDPEPIVFDKASALS
jgi:hypothetical protein